MDKQKLIENFVQMAEYTNAEVEMISRETEEGQMLENSFGSLPLVQTLKPD